MNKWKVFKFKTAENLVKVCYISNVFQSRIILKKY